MEAKLSAMMDEFLVIKEASRTSALSGAKQLITQMTRAGGQFATSGTGGGAAVGGGLGAVGNVIRESKKDDSEGPKNYLGAAVKGGLTGAAVGGTVGGVGRLSRDERLLHQYGGLLKRKPLGAGETAKRVVKRMGRNVKNFGERQVHGLTGYRFKGDSGLPGKETLKRQLDVMRVRTIDALRKAPDKATKKQILERASKDTKELMERAVEGQKLLDKGLTSAPGVAKGLVTKPKDTAKALLYERGKIRPGMAALPLAFAAPELARGDESEYGGKTMGQKLINAGTDVGATFALRGLPILPGIAAWQAADLGTRKLTGQ